MKTTIIYSVVESIWGRPHVTNFVKLKQARVHFAELVEEHLRGSDDIFVEDEIQKAILNEEYSGSINDDYAVYLQFTELHGKTK
jgi:hypothetical protein